MHPGSRTYDSLARVGQDLLELVRLVPRSTAPRSPAQPRLPRVNGSKQILNIERRRCQSQGRPIGVQARVSAPSSSCDPATKHVVVARGRHLVGSTRGSSGGLLCRTVATGSVGALVLCLRWAGGEAGGQAIADTSRNHPGAFLRRRRSQPAPSTSRMPVFRTSILVRAIPYIPARELD